VAAADDAEVPSNGSTSSSSVAATAAAALISSVRDSRCVLMPSDAS